MKKNEKFELGLNTTLSAVNESEKNSSVNHLECIYKKMPSEIYENKEEEKSKKNLEILNKAVLTGEELLNLNIVEMRNLIDPIFQQTGVVAFSGSSDTGKSSFLRQLASAIVTGKDDFLGFKINSRYNSAIYVSTEDDSNAIACLLRKQNNDFISSDFHKLRYIFESENLIERLDKMLSVEKTDCVIIDTFTDLYGDDMNASNRIRKFINDYKNLSVKHDCLFIFLHHTGKRTEENVPSKDNMLGSQGFEAKVRMVMELRRDYHNPELRHLCIVKGNYLPDRMKQNSIVLKFDENMVFSNTGISKSFELLAKPKFNDAKDSQKESAKAIAIACKKNGMSISNIEKHLNEKGYNFKRSTIGNWTKGK